LYDLIADKTAFFARDRCTVEPIAIIRRMPPGINIHELPGKPGRIKLIKLAAMKAIPMINNT
jgi:hypothetical protein